MIRNGIDCNLYFSKIDCFFQVCSLGWNVDEMSHEIYIIYYNQQKKSNILPTKKENLYPWFEKNFHRMSSLCAAIIIINNTTQKIQ